MLSEQHMEQLCLDWFRAGGYASAYKPDLAPTATRRSSAIINRWL